MGIKQFAAKVFNASPPVRAYKGAKVWATNPKQAMANVKKNAIKAKKFAIGGLFGLGGIAVASMMK